MTINTKTMDAVNVSPNIAGKNDSKAVGKTDSFASIMDISVSKNDSVTNDVTLSKKDEFSVKDSDNYNALDDNENIPKDDTSQTSVAEEIKENDDAVPNKTISDDSAKETDEDIKSSDILEVIEATDINIIDESVSLAAVLQMVIQQKYNISEEEFDELLSEAGISVEQMADETVLREVLGALENITKVDLLIDQTKAETLDRAVDEILSEAKMIVTGDKVAEEAVEIVVATNETLDGKQKNSSYLETEVTKSDEVNLDDYSVSEKKIEQPEKIAIETDGEGQNRNDNNNDTNNDSIISNLENAVDNAIKSNNIDENDFVTKVDGADVVRQVVEKVKVNNLREVSSIELNLNPESLGKVHITVESRNGVMQAKIIAETESAQKAIVAGMETLRESFNNQDLKVDVIDVMVAPHSFFEDGQDSGFLNEEDRNNNSKNNGVTIGLEGDIEDMSVESVEEEILRETIKNTVSYAI